MKEALQLRSLDIGYSQKGGDKIIAKGITANLKTGELVCLLGPNGAGKSTLMRTIAGNQKSLGGEVLMAGRNIQDHSSKEISKKLSIVTTERVQAGMLTAYEIVGLGRYPHTDWSGKLSKKDHEIIEHSIDMVAAQELADRSLSELSDGERQKIMVARALAQEPDIMILDEVTAFLDLPRRIEIIHLLKHLAYTTDKAILLSTHDMDLAMRNADQMWLLPKQGDFQVGAPEDLVLNGELEKAFMTEGLVFNKDSGVFNWKDKYNKSVSLVAEGHLYEWTKKALHRSGFEVISDAEVVIKAICDDGNYEWVLTQDAETKSYSSIYELISSLQSKIKLSN